jgi:acetolactate synthase-1/2/3 large subunit
MKELVRKISPADQRDLDDEPVPTSRRSVEDVGAPASRVSLPIALQIVDELRSYGVDTIFGIPGGAVSALYGALLKRRDVRVVNAKHESGAVFLAMGYAIATGKPGVVVTTAGPGITNALTGLASAFYDGVPILVISGEVSTAAFGRGALQESSSAGLDAVTLVRRVTKFASQISRPDAAVATLRKAVDTALSGRRGPSFISLPLNVSSAHGSNNPISGRARTSFEIDVPGCDRAYALLAEAEHPLVVAGAGARDRRARSALVTLSRGLNVPVGVTPKGKGVFPEDDPRYLGVLGFGGHESLVEYLAEGVDVLLVCGSGLNDFSTNAWSPLLKSTRAFIQIDIDAAQLGKNYPIDLGLVGPAEAVLSKIVEGRDMKPRSDFRWPGVRVQPPKRSPRGQLTTIEVVHTLNESCPPDSVFTADMGEHLSIALHYLKVRAGGDFLTCLGFGSMGSGVCTAIGYQLGSPGRRVYAVCGDGCFLMYGAELVTAVHHQIPVTFVIINDSKLNMCELGMRDLYGASTDMTTPVVDFAAWARAAGAQGHIVRTRDELITALEDPAAGPVVLDVRIDPEIRLMGSQRNAALRQFTDAS